MGTGETVVCSWIAQGKQARTRLSFLEGGSVLTLCTWIHSDTFGMLHLLLAVSGKFTSIAQITYKWHEFHFLLHGVEETRLFCNWQHGSGLTKESNTVFFNFFSYRLVPRVSMLGSERKWTTAAIRVVSVSVGKVFLALASSQPIPCLFFSVVFVDKIYNFSFFNWFNITVTLCQSIITGRT